jgi:hypothetical protein
MSLEKTSTNLDLDTSLYAPIENNNWGFTYFSEKINGRVAMMGFIILFLFELLTKQKLIDFLK